LNEEINPEECIFSFGLGFGRFSKEKISSVEEKNLFPFFSYLRDKGRFLGDTAKRASESPARLDFTHDIIGVNDTELGFGCRSEERDVEQGHDPSQNSEPKNSFVSQNKSSHLLIPS
jgi:hypothetical protein